MPKSAESIRRRIKAEEITDRLQEHMLVEPCLTQSQVATGIALLKKVAPDLKAVDLQVQGGAQVNVRIVQFGSPEATPEMIDVTPETRETLETPDLIEEMIE